MGKKQKNEYELHLQRYKTLFLLYGASVIVDFAILFGLLGSLSEWLFWGLCALHTLIISNLVGVGAAYLGCIITQKDYNARAGLQLFALGRAVILFAASVIGTLANPNWHTSDGEREQGTAFIFMLILALLGYGIQFVVCCAISDKVKLPPKPKGTTAKNSGTVVGPSDRAKESKWYKDKVEGYYNEIMGIQKPEPQDDFSDLDDHDFSHILKDK